MTDYPLYDIRPENEVVMDRIVKTPEQIGAAIRQARHHDKLTQAQLADLAGTVQKQISLIEAGNQGVRIDTICNVLAALSLNFEITATGQTHVPRVEDIF